MWTYFTDMFDFLTLSVVIDDRIFCVHGGKYLGFCFVRLPVLIEFFLRFVALNPFDRSNKSRRSVSRQVYHMTIVLS